MDCMLKVSVYSAEECERIAKEASLRYVKDTSPGISRRKYGKGFVYYAANGTRVDDEKTLKRIRALAIPPAYNQVWICPYANGHIQATGRDEKNRKQYIYHPLWHEVRQQRKFESIINFGKTLPSLRKHINKILAQPFKLTKEQVICAVIYLLDTACIRIGNTAYAKQHQSYGLTTLRKKHLSIEKNKAYLDFDGKSAQPWHIVLTDKKIINILKKCEEIPGYELFKYYDDNNQLNVITSQDVNGYLQKLTGYPFTAKDFRTWIACRETFCRLIELVSHPHSSLNKTLKNVIKEVASLLGHTPSICQTSYIAPDIIACWNEKRFESWLKHHKRYLTHKDKDKQLLYWLEHKA